MIGGSERVARLRTAVNGLLDQAVDGGQQAEDVGLSQLAEVLRAEVSRFVSTIRAS
ncbi:hypothetical protein AB0G04_03900 [Actinoplanes sp. NPDC023801]|uniref:hypothetical protein n=1 Tax=Actinoplanes sp. NPDC023801 TaxID=3154595 RepID=UPI0033E1E91B